MSAFGAVVLVGFAAWRPGAVAWRVVWGGLLLIGEVLPFVLLPVAWWHTRFVIPFLGPPVRIGLLPVWWALGAVAVAYVAAAVDTWRSRGRWWSVLLPPVHAVLRLISLRG